MSKITQQLIVTQARTWLGTPFHHQARLKGKGCDCLGLIVGVVDELELKDKTGKLLVSYDEITYSKQPDGARLITTRILMISSAHILPKIGNRRTLLPVVRRLAETIALNTPTTARILISDCNI